MVRCDGSMETLEDTIPLAALLHRTFVALFYKLICLLLHILTHITFSLDLSWGPSLHTWTYYKMLHDSLVCIRLRLPPCESKHASISVKCPLFKSSWARAVKLLKQGPGTPHSRLYTRTPLSTANRQGQGGNVRTNIINLSRYRQ